MMRIQRSHKTVFYSKTKIEAENYLMQNFKSSSWILRLAPVYSSGLVSIFNEEQKF